VCFHAWCGWGDRLRRVRTLVFPWFGCHCEGFACESVACVHVRVLVTLGNESAPQESVCMGEKVHLRLEPALATRNPLLIQTLLETHFDLENINIVQGLDKTNTNELHAREKERVTDGGVEAEEKKKKRERGERERERGNKGRHVPVLVDQQSGQAQPGAYTSKTYTRDESDAGSVFDHTDPTFRTICCLRPAHRPNLQAQAFHQKNSELCPRVSSSQTCGADRQGEWVDVNANKHPQIKQTPLYIYTLRDLFLSLGGWVGDAGDLTGRAGTWTKVCLREREVERR
jgi:hypothetical protein